ncbi:D-alanyl-D-alanine carboxypeptidase family protein [Metabacillus sp. RGM 3146]|uniref:D-alanyl-D-alanine carboxypeptidase family protein n=1 Tax=Metabacillus sp. RGM 3146 TaxID=3401092 RepID=UPI003B9D3B8E
MNKIFRWMTFFITAMILAANQLPAKAAEQKSPHLESEAAVLIDSKSGQILDAKNSRSKMSPASITKVATAIYAIEKGNLNDEVTVSQKARNVDGTRVYLEAGERVTLKHLIQGLLINSGNDAGVAIAEHMSGSTEAFAKDLNAYLANEIGVKHTHFTNPHGLYNPEHYTTAEDMAIITKHALQYPEFRKIFGTVKLKWTGEKWKTTLYNHHRLLHEHYSNITGGKNGYVAQAGFTLVTAAEKNGLNLIAVTLKAPSDQASYDDTIRLLNDGFSHFQSGRISNSIAFENDQGKEFHLKEPLFYTKRKNETIKTNVTSAGVLEVKGEDGRVLTSSSLEPDKKQMKEKLLSAATVSKDVSPSAILTSHFHWVILLSIVFVMLFGAVFFLQAKRL